MAGYNPACARPPLLTHILSPEYLQPPYFIALHPSSTPLHTPLPLITPSTMSSISALLDEFDNMSPPPRSLYTPPPYFDDEYRDVEAILQDRFNWVSTSVSFSIGSSQ